MIVDNMHKTGYLHQSTIHVWHEAILGVIVRIVPNMLYCRRICQYQHSNKRFDSLYNYTLDPISRMESLTCV